MLFKSQSSLKMKSRHNVLFHSEAGHRNSSETRFLKEFEIDLQRMMNDTVVRMLETCKSERVFRLLMAELVVRGLHEEHDDDGGEELSEYIEIDDEFEHVDKIFDDDFHLYGEDV